MVEFSTTKRKKIKKIKKSDFLIFGFIIKNVKEIQI